MKFWGNRSWIVNRYGPTIGPNGTMAFWIKNTDITTLQVIMSNYSAGSGSFLIAINAGTIFIQGNQCALPNTSVSFLGDGDWHHMALVKSASAGTCEIFVDGESWETVAAASDVAFGKGIMIGNHSGYDAIGQLGLLDDVRLYNRALSSTEVASLATGLYPTRTGGSTLTTTQDITTTDAFNIWNGTFALAGNSVTAPGSYINYGTVSLGGGTITHTPTLAVSSPTLTIGNSLTYTVTDPAKNLDASARETISLAVEEESLTLTETTASSGIFQGTINSVHGERITNNGFLENERHCTFAITVTYPGSNTVQTIVTDSACEQTGGGGGGGGGSGIRRTTSTEQNSSDSSSATSGASSRFSSPNISSAATFSDVPASTWFSSAVAEMVRLNIISGYTDAAGNLLNQFGPADPVTVGQTIKIALLAGGHNLPSPAGTPQNSTATDWSAPYIALAESLNITLSSQDVIRPATRGEVIQALLEAFDIEISSSGHPFTDLSSSHPQAAAISVAYNLGFVTGDTDADGNPLNTVRPDDSINRAEVAAMVVRMLEGN